MTEALMRSGGLFQAPGYSRVWLSGLVYYLAFWFEIIVGGWIVLELTGSAFSVGLVGFFRMGPMLIFGLLLGTVADQIRRPDLMLVVQLTGLSAASALVLLSTTERLAPWHVYLLVGIIGCGWAADFPARRALISELLNESLITRAMSMEALSLFASKIVATVLAGLLLATAGVRLSYVGLVSIYVLSFILVLQLKRTLHRAAFEGEDLPERVGLLAALRAGWSASINVPVIRGVLIITAVMNLLVLPYQQLVAIIADDILHVGAWRMGLLASADGAGAILATSVLVFGRASSRDGLLFVGGTIIGCLLLVGLALSSIYSLALLIQLVIGACFGVFSALQAALILSVSEASVRARALGMLATAIGVTPFGMLLIGGLSAMVGASAALVSLGTMAALLVMLIAVLNPSLRAVERAPLPAGPAPVAESAH